MPTNLWDGTLDRVLVVAVLALVVALTVAGGRLLARRNLGRLRRSAPWDALALAPDGRPAVVAFSTPGCAECPLQHTLLEELARRRSVRLIDIDASERPEVARFFGVMTAPTTVVLGPAGEVLAANHGLAGLAELEGQLGA